MCLRFISQYRTSCLKYFFLYNSRSIEFLQLFFNYQLLSVQFNLTKMKVQVLIIFVLVINLNLKCWPKLITELKLWKALTISFADSAARKLPLELLSNNFFVEIHELNFNFNFISNSASKCNKCEKSKTNNNFFYFFDWKIFADISKGNR